MARSKVKFKVSLEGFSIEFEGDQEDGQIIGQSIGQSLAGLATMPSQLLAAQKLNRNSNQTIPASFIDPGHVADNGNVAEKKANKSPRSRGPKGESPQALIETLVNEGFFSQKRLARDVGNELKKKGYSYDGSSLSTPMNRLTRKNVLQREESAKGYLYEKAESN